MVTGMGPGAGEGRRDEAPHGAMGRGELLQPMQDIGIVGLHSEVKKKTSRRRLAAEDVVHRFRQVDKASVAFGQRSCQHLECGMCFEPAAERI